MARNNDTTTDALLRREVFLQRFASHLVNTDVDGAIQSFARKLPSLLNEFGDAEGLSLTERRAVNVAVNIEMRKELGTMWDSITEDLDKMALMDVEHVKGIYVEIEGVTLAVPADKIILGSVNQSTMVLTSGQSSQAGKWVQFLKQNTDTATKAINGSIWNGYTSGLTNQQISQEIRGTFNRKTKMYEGGILQGRVKAQADALVRTGTNHFSNQARDVMYKANDDILGKRILFATKDSRTSPICIKRHLKEWDITDNTYPRLPFHFNERSVYTVTIKGEEGVEGDSPSVGGKINADGKLTSEVKIIPADTTWDSFLRRQPKEFIEDVLGKKKAKLFIDGGMDIDRFTTLTGRPLTLEQLAAKPSNKKAFQKADL